MFNMDQKCQPESDGPNNANTATDNLVWCDDTIVTRIASGCRAAESKLAMRCEEVLLNPLRRLTTDSQLRQDLQQETFCSVLVRLRRSELHRSSKLAGYIYRTAVFLFYAEIRKYRSRQSPLDPAVMGDAVFEGPSATENLNCANVATAINRAIKSLSVPRDRELLRRLYLYEQDKTTVASFLGVTSRHFDRIHFRAKSRLRQLLDENMAYMMLRQDVQKIRQSPYVPIG